MVADRLPVAHANKDRFPASLKEPLRRGHEDEQVRLDHRAVDHDFHPSFGQPEGDKLVRVGGIEARQPAPQGVGQPGTENMGHLFARPHPVQGVGDLDLDVFRSHTVLFQKTHEDREAKDAEILILGMIMRGAAVLYTDRDLGARLYQLLQRRHADRIGQRTAERGCGVGQRRGRWRRARRDTRAFHEQVGGNLAGATIHHELLGLCHGKPSSFWLLDCHSDEDSIPQEPGHCRGWANAFTTPFASVIRDKSTRRIYTGSGNS